MSCFSVLKSWHKYLFSHLNRVKNGRFISLKIGNILLKKFLLKLNFLDEEQLYANFQLYSHYLA